MYLQIAEDLLNSGYSIQSNVFETRLLQNLLDSCLEQYQDGAFHPARIGQGIEQQKITAIRSDKVLWLNSNDTVAIEAFFMAINELRSELSNFFRISLKRTEAHFAVYPENSFYKRHLDQFKGSNERIFTFILYLNENWKTEYGGQLRFYTNVDNNFIDIEPAFGKLVVFRSDLFEHEVLKVHQKRISLTGWFRADELIPLL